MRIFRNLRSISYAEDVGFAVKCCQRMQCPQNLRMKFGGKKNRREEIKAQLIEEYKKEKEIKLFTIIFYMFQNIIN